MRGMTARKLVINEDNARLIFSTNSSDGRIFFFGYYTFCPWNARGDKLLAHCINAGGNKAYLSKYDEVKMGFINLLSGEFCEVARSNACNWQQGSLLQWLPAKDAERIVYNDRRRDVLGSTIVDVNSGRRRRLEWTVYTVHPKGGIALGLNMERLYVTRKAYSYDGEYEKKWQREVVKDDGIYEIDLDIGTRYLLIRTKDISAIDPTPIMRGALHWLAHPMFSPSGKHFLFYHRWMTKKGSFFTRIYTSDCSGAKLNHYPDSGMYSHATWVSDDQLIVFGRLEQSKIRRGKEHAGMRLLIEALLPLYRIINRTSLMHRLRRRLLSEHYLLFSVGEKNYKIIGESELTEDGHPSISPTRPSLLLLDTYPDTHHYRHLYVYDMIKGKLYWLGTFASPRHHNASSPDRCDLHPRWSPNGRQVCIDSMHEGYRHIYILEIADHIVE